MEGLYLVMAGAPPPLGQADHLVRLLAGGASVGGGHIGLGVATIGGRVCHYQEPQLTNCKTCRKCIM